MSSFNLKQLETCFKQPTIKNTFLGLYETLGTLTAIASSPETIKPSEWMIQLKASPDTDLAFDSEQQVKELSVNLIAWWNYCMQLFDEGQQIDLPVKLGLTPTGAPNKALKDFSNGYLKGFNWLSKLWQTKIPDNDSDQARSLSVLNMILARFVNEKAMANAEPELVRQLPDMDGCFQVLPGLISAVGMLGKDLSTEHEEIDEKVTPIQVEKIVGRNEPCPCGSGKKFKKCCLH